jgi:cytidylate kinase
MCYSIAIDGPSGAGKSTIADALAKRLGILHLDTGAMYRAIALKTIRLGIDFNDENTISKVLQDTEIDVKFENGLQMIFLDGENVNSQIRVHEISQAAAKISTLNSVRTVLANAQRNIAQKYNMVVDGRDIGTNVLPCAKYKFFLTADDNIRAERRYQELKSRGQEIDFETVLNDIKQRDQMDTTREFSPLKRAEDAVLIDSSNLTPLQVVDTMLSHIKELL